MVLRSSYRHQHLMVLFRHVLHPYVLEIILEYFWTIIVTGDLDEMFMLWQSPDQCLRYMRQNRIKQCLVRVIIRYSFSHKGKLLPRISVIAILGKRKEK